MKARAKEPVNPVALLTRLKAGDRDPGKALSVLYCSSCFMFHPVICFHRDGTTARGYRYVCAEVRRRTRPQDSRVYQRKRKPCSCSKKRGDPHIKGCPRRRLPRG